MMNNSLSPMSVFVSLAFGLLAGCHSDAPVAANSAEATKNVSGSLSSRTVVVPDNFVANEDAREAGPLKPSEGMKMLAAYEKSLAGYTYLSLNGSKPLAQPGNWLPLS